MSVRFDVTAGIGVIIIDRPPANALDREHQAALEEAAREATQRQDVRAVIIRGAAEIFSAGADIREMSSIPANEMRAHAPRLQRAFTAVAEIPQPVCAAIEGFALGGGLELALAADFRVCAEDAYIGLTEITLGVIPGAGGTQRLTRIVGPARAKLAVMTGARLDSRAAATLGLVDRVVPHATATEEARNLLSQFVDGPRAALGAAKRAIDAATSPDGFTTETRLFAPLFGTADQIEGMTAFLEKRKPKFH